MASDAEKREADRVPSSIAQTVKTFAEYESTIARLRQQNEGMILVFRGQVMDRPLTASLRRAGEVSRGYLNPDTHFSWSEFAARALGHFGRSTDRAAPLAMGILQHYGAQSSFLDVTHDPTVALWFSLNRFVTNGTMVLDGAQHPHMRFHPMIMASYVPSGSSEGFVYVIGLPANIQGADFVDLEREMPPSILRVHRQRAALLASGQVDWNAQIVARLRITGQLLQHEFPEEVSVRRLFPAPEEDALYAELMRVPFVAPFRDTSDHLDVWPLLLIPYYGSASLSEFLANDLRLVTKYLTVTPGHYFLPYARAAFAGDAHKHQDGRYELADAMGIVVPRVYDWKLDESQLVGEGILDFPEAPPCVAPNILREQWEGTEGNIFIEFQLGAYLVWPGGNECSLVRGLWVLMEPDSVYVTTVWEFVGKRGGRMKMEDGMHFEYRKGVYHVAPKEGDCSCPSMMVHFWWLEVFLRATRWLHEGGCTAFWDDETGMLHMQRPNEDALVGGSRTDPSTDG